MAQCNVTEKSPSANRFDTMIANCHQYTTQQHENGVPIVGILCEYTPRELILAAGAVPVCLCGGSEEKIAVAEQDLPAGLCPLIKSTYGYHRTQSNPFLKMASVVIAETTCDGKKKMYELMAQNKTMLVLELPQKPDDPDAFDHWMRELAKCRAALERQLNTTITDEKLRQAIALMNRERRLRRQLAEQMKQATPPWTGQQLLTFKSIISGIDADLAEYQRLISLANSNGGCCANRNKVRVLLTGVPTVHGAEKVVDIIENAGALIVCMENCTGIKPIDEDVDETAADPLEAIARKYFHLPCSVMTQNHGRITLLERLIADYRPDCIVDLVWQGCLTYDVESYFVRQLAEAKSLPYLKIVTDYSPSDAARIAVRVEALLETAKERRH
ncbi:MAG: double-cubane-cluster-containing anaerobic reductase [Anaerohalosphaeraceae bacterium]